MISSDAPQTPLLQAMKLLQLLFVYAKVGTLVSAIYEMVMSVGQAILLFSGLTFGVGVAFTVLLDEVDYGDEGPEFGSTFAIPWFSIYGCAPAQPSNRPRADARARLSTRSSLRFRTPPRCGGRHQPGAAPDALWPAQPVGDDAAVGLHVRHPDRDA